MGVQSRAKESDSAPALSKAIRASHFVLFTLSDCPAAPPIKHMHHSINRALSRIACLFLVAPLPAVAQNIFGNFSYTDDGSSITITHYRSDGLENVVIPPTINNKPVTAIDSNAFNSANMMRTISIPATVSVIRAQAFAYCPALTGVSLPTGLLTIETGAFYNCRRLESIILPGGLKSIGESAFQLTGLTSVVIPGAVTFLGGKSFADCRKLEIVRFDGHLEEIGDSTFSACAKLERVDLPQGLLRIGVSAFAGCALSSINLDGVRELGRVAFGSCPKLSHVVFPKSVLEIGDAAFSYCGQLAAGVFDGNAPKLGNSVFKATHPDFKLIVSDNSKGFTVPRWNGYKVSRPEAEIAVLNDKGTQLPAVGGTHKFNPSRVGQADEAAAVFTIRNVGNRKLSDLSASISGGNSKDFFYSRPTGWA